MKRFVTLALTLILLIGICAPALADTYPKATFAAESKNLWVKYGSTISWKLKLNCGSYKKVKSSSGGYIYRAGFTMWINGNGDKEKLLDYDWSGNGNKTFSIEVSRKKDSIFTNPETYTRYKATLTTYYKPTIGTKVYPWTKCSATSTYFYVYNPDFEFDE